ncbi:BTAD domain-containing putative transcriptional regulator [Kutzneria viridogrisea]|uniref:OmpR/PhoB-type domain-containing protein n=2 Tax=Kutzneria TaxID=43356 RepID=W5W8Q0_9PSEU|nr:AfsR/SARP family transcriptional regulator [Kutzneria albida]AHH96916.1 hypothetical protein KALB_3552 [Kutzneria albida DSM 43870]MBA8927861.1 DNA-binding SARP family transcriptional activator/tetratricopeptide (TPR) repeat protein [Kutzneria viridogrisea]
MEFAILGSLRVSAGDRVVPLAAAKHRVLLAALLLRANHVVPVAELAERLWGSEPPASAKATLQGYVLRLRRGLTAQGGADPIETRPPGYLIRVAPGELDLDVFRTLVAESERAATAGDLDTAAGRLRQAGALWRGPALSDVPSDSLHATAGPWLAELRRSAVERRVDLDLRRGEHTQLVGELTELVADNPLHERFRAQLMLALHRCGRSADALEVYRDARATFVEELGIEPGEPLRELERAVLAGDPGLDWRCDADPPKSAPPRALPPDLPDLVGRDVLVHDMLARLSAPPRQPGSPVVQVIAGMAGVGKTALAVHLGHRLRDRFPDGQLHVTLQDGAGAVPPAEALGRLLRLLGVLGNHLPDSVEARSLLLRDRLAGKRALLLLDDAVDEAQVRPLLPGDSSCTVLVTSRNRLTGLSGAHTVDLRVLDEQQAVRLLGTVVGGDRVRTEPRASAELVRQCGGLPLALRIAGARLAARTSRPVDWLVRQLEDERRRLDGLSAGDLRVRASLATSYRALDPEQQRAFRLLGLLNTGEYTPQLAAAALDREPHRAEELVEQLVDAQLVDFTGVADRYRSHGLVRLYAREQAVATDSEADRRGVVERTLTTWLAATTQAEARMPNAGWWPCPPPRPVRARVEPVGDALAWFDAERAELGVAVDQAVSEGHAELGWRIAAASGCYLELRGYWDEWRQGHERALAGAVAAGDEPGAALMRYGLGRLWFAKDHYELALDMLCRALDSWARLDDRSSQAHTQSLLGDVHHHTGRLDLAGHHFRLAHRGYEAVGDDRGLANSQLCLGLLHRDLGEPGQALGCLREALDGFRALGDQYGEAQVLRFLGASHGKWGQPDIARDYFTQAAALYREFGDRLGELRSVRHLGHVLALHGDGGHARRVLLSCHASFAEIGDSFGVATACWSLGELALREADPRAADRWLREALELVEEAGLVHWQARMLRLLAETHRRAGQSVLAEQLTSRADALAMTQRKTAAVGR